MIIEFFSYYQSTVLFINLNILEKFIQEKTLEEGRVSLKEVIELILQSNRELAEREIGDKDVIREVVTVSIE